VVHPAELLETSLRQRAALTNLSDSLRATAKIARRVRGGVVGANLVGLTVGAVQRLATTISTPQNAPGEAEAG